MLRPDKGKIMEVVCDADFTGNWDHKETEDRNT